MTLALPLAAWLLGAQGIGADAECPVRLSISAFTSEILPHQPLRVLVEARVEGDQPFRGALNLSAQSRRALLVVGGPESTRSLALCQLASDALEDSLPPATARTYRPGDTTRADIFALYDFQADEYLFSAPGAYRVQAMLDVSAGEGNGRYKAVRIESNVLQIEVAEPSFGSGPAYLWTRPWQVQMFVGIGLRDIREWLAAYPETSYPHYARFALARNRDFPAQDRIALLRELVGSKPPAQIADLALLQLAELLLAEGQYDACRSYAQQVLDLPAAPEHSKTKASELIKRASRALGR